MDTGERPKAPHIALAGELLKVVKSKEEGHSRITWVDPDALRELLQKHWSRISILAHAIHADQDKPKTTREKIALPGNMSDLRQGLDEMLDRIEAIENRERYRQC